MYTLLTGKHPFYKKGDNEKAYINLIANEELEMNPIDDIAFNLVLKLCSRSVTERYSAH